MKKLFAIVLSAGLVLVLSACSADDVSKFKDFVARLDEQKVADTVNDLQKVVDGPNLTDTSSTSAPVSQYGPTAPDKANLINRDRAIEIALNHAGLTRVDVRDLEAELDYEPNGVFWEVDFEANRLEYSYDVNAETEEVTRVEKERD